MGWGLWSRRGGICRIWRFRAEVRPGSSVCGRWSLVVGLDPGFFAGARALQTKAGSSRLKPFGMTSHCGGWPTASFSVVLGDDRRHVLGLGQRRTTNDAFPYDLSSCNILELFFRERGRIRVAAFCPSEC